MDMFLKGFLTGCVIGPILLFVFLFLLGFASVEDYEDEEDC